MKSTLSSASNASMVTSIVSSSVVRKGNALTLMVAPTAAEGLLTCEKPTSLVASPVVGLNALPPLAKVVRIFVALAERPSVEKRSSAATIRFSVTSKSNGVVLVTVTSCVAQKVSRGFSVVKAASVELVSLKPSPLPYDINNQ